MLSNEVRANFESVVQHLESERQQVQIQVAVLQNRLRELQSSIATLRKHFEPSYSTLLNPTSLKSPSSKYADISVRWAILDLLKDSQPMTTAAIAEALKAAGVQTRAANFANNVSAVLSGLVKRDEVEQLPDNKWELTDRGDSAINHIRSLPKFKKGVSGATLFA